MGDGPLLSICMIVRNEEDCLTRCLKSVADVADEIVIVDTGSVDNTREIAKEFGARLFEAPWPGDFSLARNFSLAEAKGEWILVLDADEELDPASRKVLEETLAETEIDGVVCTLIDKRTDCTTNGQICRLFRNHPQHRFEGAIHEQIINAIIRRNGKVVSRNINILHYGYQEQYVKAKFKRARNISLLEGIIAAGKANYSTYYHLGREYQRLGDLENAVACYRQSFELSSVESSITHDLLRRLADSLLELEQDEDALEILKLAQEAYPDFTDLFLIEAKIYCRDKKWEEARRCLEYCLELGEAPVNYTTLAGAGSYLALELLGDIAVAEKRNEDALAYYQNAYQTSTRRKQLVLGMLDLKIITEGLAGAVRFVEENNFFVDNEVAEAMAGFFAKRGEFAFALKSLANLPEADLTLEARQVAVFSYLHTGKFSSAAELAPALLETKYNQLALVVICLELVRQNKFSEAKDYARRLAQPDSSNDGFWLLEQLLLALNGGSISPGKRSIKQGQIQEMVEFVIRTGNLEATDVLVSKVLVNYLSITQISSVLGKVWFNIGEFEKAAELLIRAYDSGVYDSESLKMLGTIAERAGYQDEALLLYKEAIVLGKQTEVS